MKTNRIKVSLPQLLTRDDAETAMTDLAAVINEQRAHVANRDALVLKINKQFEAPLSNLDQAIKAKTDLLRNWAETSPDQFPKGRKSLELVSGTLGFRTGTPKLSLLSRAWSWDKVLDRLCSAAKEYVRSKLEVDKESLLTATAENRVLTSDLASYGVKVTQDESFYIEPKLTSLETRQTSEAA